MTRLEAVAAASMAYLTATAGFTWLFGPYALIGAGVVVLVLLFFVDVKE